MRPCYLDRLGIDDRLLACALLVLVLIGCEIPIVPIPDPINPPGPVIVVPVTQGQRIALILHESRDQTPELASLIVELQAGTSSAYFARHHHSVVALDIDAKDENRQPLQVITRLKPVIGSKTLPVLIVADKTKDGRLGNVLLCESIKPGAVANEVIAAVEKTGGGD